MQQDVMDGGENQVKQLVVITRPWNESLFLHRPYAVDFYCILFTLLMLIAVLLAALASSECGQVDIDKY